MFKNDVFFHNSYLSWLSTVSGASWTTSPSVFLDAVWAFFFVNSLLISKILLHSDIFIWFPPENKSNVSGNLNALIWKSAQEHFILLVTNPSHV